MEKQDKDFLIETDRLYLREMKDDDFDPCKAFLSDPEVMYAYEHGFDDDEVRRWIEQNKKRYEDDGFGLWMMVDKKTGEAIGDCGITWQLLDNEPVLEIGYHLRKDKWHQHYASEAAKACKKYAFEHLKADRITSIIRDTNTASQNVATANGMKPVEFMNKSYWGMIMPHIVYEITAEDYYRDQANPELLKHE